MVEQLAVCRLASGAHVPNWALEGGFFCVVRTREELSIVCREDVCKEIVFLPALQPSADGWR